MKAQLNSSTDYVLPEPGLTPARCVAVIDLGTHTSDKYKNEKTGKFQRQHKVQIQFEIDQTIDVNGEQKPMMVTKRYTLSADKKSTLRAHLEGWYGKKFKDEDIRAAGGFDMQKILGRAATLNLVHSEDGQFCNIETINPPMKSSGDGAAPQFHPSKYFYLGCFDQKKQEWIGSPDWDVFMTLSEKTRQFIRESEEVTSGSVVVPDFVNVGKPAETSAPKPQASGDSDAPF